MLNTPHNPTGKVFSREELEGIAALVHKYPKLVVMSDEVYEFMVFDDLKVCSDRRDLVMLLRCRTRDLASSSPLRVTVVVFDTTSKHERISALPGMFDRTLSVHSAGKTFSATGWRIGYVIGQ